MSIKCVSDHTLYGASADWCTCLQCCLLAVWLWLGCFVGGFDCAVVFVVIGDARPLLLSPRNTVTSFKKR